MTMTMTCCKLFDCPLRQVDHVGGRSRPIITIYISTMCQVDQGGGPGKRPTTAGKKIKTQANELVAFIIELIIFIVIIKNPPPPKA